VGLVSGVTRLTVALLDVAQEHPGEFLFVSDRPYLTDVLLCDRWSQDHLVTPPTKKSDKGHTDAALAHRKYAGKDATEEYEVSRSMASSETAN
jgi:hypothetical protein